MIERFLEQGREIPPELLAKSGWPGMQARLVAPAAPQRSRLMRRGVILIALAAGVAILFYIGSGDIRGAAWGLPFLCLGIATFINARFFTDSGSSD